ncbi:hypothetical protein [Parasphingorhabdus flavimaris]|uniref:hypothetical protein n=1 Tax=Parasphingorhabdus flavimaris TaxID=266812 RepID=UPI0030033B1A
MKRTVVIADSKGPSGTVDYESALSDDAPEHLLEGERAAYRRAAYGDSIRQAEDWVTGAHEPDGGSADSTLSKASDLRELTRLALIEYHQASASCRSMSAKSPLPFRLDAMARAAAAVGAIFNEASMTGALKEDRDKQTTARKIRKASVTKLNNERKPTNQDADIEALQEAARGIEGWKSKPKTGIISVLRSRRKIPVGIANRSDRWLQQELGKEFGQQGNARKSMR